MKKKVCSLMAVLAMVCAGVTVLYAGSSLDQAAAPSDAGSAMSTITDVYNCINRGDCPSPRSGAFVEPSTGPAGTGKTLNELMDTAKKRSRPAKTGQTKCYDAAGTEIACAGTGQDGEKLKGVILPTSPRFTNNGNGTVTDHLTGLIWLTNANCPNATRAWATALTDVASLNSAGTMNGNNCGDTSNSGTYQTDWRLPNLRELQSLIHYGYFNPALSNAAGTGKWSVDDPFSNFQSNAYWTSSTVAQSTTAAFYVNLYNGVVSTTAKSTNYYVWPVRGGQ
jgi:hypothetical protein